MQSWIWVACRNNWAHVHKLSQLLSYCFPASLHVKEGSEHRVGQFVCSASLILTLLNQFRHHLIFVEHSCQVFYCSVINRPHSSPGRGKERPRRMCWPWLPLEDEQVLKSIFNLKQFWPLSWPRRTGVNLNALAPRLNFELNSLFSHVTKGGKKLLARWRNVPADHRISAGTNGRQQGLIECLLKMSPRCPPLTLEPDMPDWEKVPRLPSRQPERESPCRRGHRKSQGLKREMDGKTGVIQLKVQSLLYKSNFRQSFDRNLSRGWTAEISTLKSRPPIPPTSNWKCFQLVVILHDSVTNHLRLGWVRLSRDENDKRTLQKKKRITWRSGRRSNNES